MNRASCTGAPVDVWILTGHSAVASTGRPRRSAVANDQASLYQSLERGAQLVNLDLDAPEISESLFTGEDRVEATAIDRCGGQHEVLQHRSQVQPAVLERAVLG